MRPLALLLGTLFLVEYPVAGQEPGDQKAVFLRQLVDTGTLGCLRWPNFSNIQADVRRLYVSIGYSPAWVRDGAATVQARQAVQALENAAWKGLDPEDYDGSRWEKRIEGLSGGHSSEGDLAQFDLALTISVMRYASDLHSGKVNPLVFCFGLDISRKQCDLAALLRDRLIHASKVQAELEKLEPPFEGYRRTEAALQRYSRLAREDDGELLPATRKPVEPGDSYPGAARLARLLRLLGDLPASANISESPQVYEGTLVDAVKRFQIRHGIDPDGRIGKATLNTTEYPARATSPAVTTRPGALALGSRQLSATAHRCKHSGIPAPRL